jgi:hypothetical protein
MSEEAHSSPAKNFDDIHSIFFKIQEFNNGPDGAVETARVFRR